MSLLHPFRTTVELRFPMVTVGMKYTTMDDTWFHEYYELVWAYGTLLE